MVPVPNSRHERQLKGCSPLVVLAELRRADPLVPVQALGDGLARRAFAVAAEIAAEDGVRLGDVADRPGPDVLADRADRLAVMALVAHLRRHVLFFGGLHQGVALGHVVGHGLLHEGRLAQLDRPHGRRGVVVVGRGNEHDVEILAALVEHLAVIVVGADVGGLVLDPLDGLGHDVVVHVDQGHGPLVGGDARVPAAHAAAADHADAELRVGRPVGQHGRDAKHRYPGSRAGDSGRLPEKIATRGTHGHGQAPSVRRVVKAGRQGGSAEHLATIIMGESCRVNRFRSSLAAAVPSPAHAEESRQAACA